MSTAVIHKVRPYLLGTVLDIGMHEFVSPQGIEGLCRESGPRLDILAVVATKPGTGQFRAFIEACKEKYAHIRILELWNEGLPDVLTRYGFSPFESIEPRDGPMTGMEWFAPNPPRLESLKAKYG